MRRAFLVLVALIVPTLPAGAGKGVWTGGGPQGGDVLALQEDHELPEVLYLRTKANGIFRSDDAGARWGRANAGLPARVRDFTVAEQGILLAVTGSSGDVWRSLDRGATWQTTRSPVPGGLHAWAVAAAPSMPGTVYVGALEGNDTRIFRSDDLGDHWTLVGSHLLEVIELTTTPLRPGSLFLSPRHGSLQRSDDGGRSWRGMGPARHWRKLAIDAGRPGRLLALASLSPIIHESLDDGETWHVLTVLPVPQWFDFTAIAVDPLDRDRLTIAFQFHLWESTDGGAHWRGTEPPGTWLRLNDVVILRTGAERRVLLTTEGPYRGAAGYGEAGVEGLEARVPDWVWSPPGRPDAVATGDFWSGPWLSVDGGVRWQPRYAGLVTHGLWNVAFAGTSDGSVLYAGVGSDVWRSRLRRGWSQLEMDLSVGNISVVEVTPSERIVIAGFGTSTIGYFSDDDGRSWSPFYELPVSGFHEALDLSVSPVNEEQALVASRTNSGCVLDRTTDEGLSWERVMTGGLGHCGSLRIERDSSAPHTVYLLSRSFGPGLPSVNDHLLRSLDGGATWEAIGEGLPCFGAVAVDPGNSDVYVGCDRLYVSHDRGLSWAPFDAAGFPPDLRFISALTAVPDGAGVTLHAGTNAGIYSYTRTDR